MLRILMKVVDDHDDHGVNLVSEDGNLIWPIWAARMRSYQIYIVTSVATHSPKVVFSKCTCTLHTLVSYNALCESCKNWVLSGQL